MSEWRNCKLADVADVIDSMHQTPKYSALGKSLVRVTDLKNGYLSLKDCLQVTEEVYQTYSSRHKSQEGDIVFARVGSYGNLGFVNKPMDFCLGQNTAFIIPKEDARYLYYYLKSPLGQNEIEASVGGSTQPTVSIKSIKNFEILLPPLPEQKAIASVLSSLDDKIDLLHRQNKTLEAMAETLFRQWFIEEAKEDWGEIAFGELVDLHDSKRVPLSQLQRDEKRVGQLYPYYGASGIIDYINAHIFEGDYLLLSEDGENLRTRKTPIAFEANGKFWVNNHAHVMQAKQPYTNGLLRILLEGENLDSIITGAVQPKINQANLIGYKIPNFPHDLVQQYVTVSEPWFEKVSSNKQQIQTLENLRDTLLPKLMSGEVRVQYQTEEVA